MSMNMFLRNFLGIKNSDGVTLLISTLSQTTTNVFNRISMRTIYLCSEDDGS